MFHFTTYLWGDVFWCLWQWALVWLSTTCMTWCAKSWFTEWTLANAANWKACSDEFVRFERWETLEGVDLIFVFLLVAALEHRISNSVSVMEFRRQRQECCQSMSWQWCWVCFLSRSCHQGSEVHFNRNGMTGRNRTANVEDAECQLTTMCVRQILLNVFKLDVFHRWHYPFHAVRSWWLMICTYVAEKLQQYRASRSFSTQVCVDTFRMLISFKAVYLRQDDILFCSWTSCNACCLHPSKGLHSVYGVIGFLFGLVIIDMCWREWLNQDLIIAMGLALLTGFDMIRVLGFLNVDDLSHYDFVYFKVDCVHIMAHGREKEGMCLN